MFRLKKKTLRILFFLFLPLFLIIIPTLYIKPLKITIVDFFRIPLKLSSNLLIELRSILNYRSMLRENIKLKKENNSFRQNLLQIDELTKENARLRDLLTFKKNSTYTLIASQVIGKDPSNWSSSIILDKGKNDRIKEGSVVITSLGLVGRIIEVGKTTSKVVLITDPNLSVAATVQRSRQEGIACGALDGRLIMRYLPKDSDIEVGDTILTSSTSSVYRQGILIGKIIKIRGQSSRQGMYAIIQPAVNLNTLEEVLITLE